MYVSYKRVDDSNPTELTSQYTRHDNIHFRRTSTGYGGMILIMTSHLRPPILWDSLDLATIIAQHNLG